MNSSLFIAVFVCLRRGKNCFFFFFCCCWRSNKGQKQHSCFQLPLLQPSHLLYQKFFSYFFSFPSCAYVSFPTGVCDDRCVWSGVHYQDLECRLLLPLPGLAGTPALRQEALLCHRYGKSLPLLVSLLPGCFDVTSGVLESSAFSSGCSSLLLFFSHWLTKLQPKSTIITFVVIKDMAVIHSFSKWIELAGSCKPRLAKV